MAPALGRDGGSAAASVGHDENPLIAASNIAHIVRRFVVLDRTAFMRIGDLTGTLLSLCKNHHATAGVVVVRALANV